MVRLLGPLRFVALLFLVLVSAPASAFAVFPHAALARLTERALPINANDATSGTAQLNVTVVSASVDTLWVQLSASGVDVQKCTDYCGYSVLETYFEVSPCVLAGPTAYHVCQNGVTPGEISAPRTLALKPSVTYTMWAQFARYGFSYSTSDHGCTNQACLYSERTPDLVYTPVLTATTPITWGAVKAMYRSP